MRLLRCVFAFSVSFTGLIASHKADADVHCLPGTKAVEIGRDFHRCDPVAWICKSQGANGHWGQGWSDNRDRATQRAIAECSSHGGGQACSNTTCGHPRQAGASTTAGRLDGVVGKTPPSSRDISRPTASRSKNGNGSGRPLPPGAPFPPTGPPGRQLPGFPPGGIYGPGKPGYLPPSRN
ncbi:hypothetical protein SAMN05444321_5992 [Bradyrhizobium lablabi]|nr:hypothetical protein SAMN05444321_5992 [Bradyrhizobium lablabi]